MEAEPDVHFEPIVQLAEVQAKSELEDEDQLFKTYACCCTCEAWCLMLLSRRAKMFRFDKGANEWKERGTGDVKILQHKETKKVRVLMRRDKTMKVCANHLSW